MRGQAVRRFQVDLQHLDRYRFSSQASEDGVLHGSPYVSDEPDPVGDASGPSTPALLASAIGHCLSASLLETLRKSRIEVSAFNAKAVSVVAPNEEGLPRIQRVEITLEPRIKEYAQRIQQCEAVFQQYCTVCASLKPALDVQVKVDWQYENIPVQA
jgi:organic hydroperoxide reductase OsmC/OhrA